MSKKSKPSSKPKEKKTIKIKKQDWLGLNHEAVAKKFEGDLSFINYMNVGDKGDLVAAVYHAKKPNLEKGHKEFMLLWKYYDFTTDKDQWMVSGMTREQIEKHAKVEGILCMKCNTALWSLNRHNYHTCGCKNDTMVDGGKDYLKAGAKDISKTRGVTINLLTDKIVLDAEPQAK